MEEDIKQIFNKIYSDAENGDGPREALEILNSFYENPVFFQSLFSLFRDTSEEHPIRLLSIIELKRQLKLHWNGFPREFQQVFLENVPNLIIGITTQEPKYHLLISDFINTLLILTFDEYFSDYWAQIIDTFIDSDPDYFFSGILILINVFQIPGKTRYLTEFIPFFRELLEKITNIYSQEELTPFLKSQCVLAAISIVKNDPVICLEEFFLPWYESVTTLTSEDSTFLLPFTKETAYYMTNLIELFRTCQIKFSDSSIDNFDEIPYTSELIYICFEIMLEPQWEDNSNLSLISNVFKFFAIFAERAKNAWRENFLPKFPEIVQNVFLPIFSLSPDAYQLIISSPMEFISEYHVDPESCQNFDNEAIKFQSNEDEAANNNNEEEEDEDEQQMSVYYERNYGSNDDSFIADYEDPDIPIVSAALCLKQVCKYEEIHEFLFYIPSETLTEFLASEDQDFLYLYSVFHMVHSYWDTIVLEHYEDAVGFMDQLLPLFQESIENPSSISSDKASVYLFQSSLLLIISRANPFISQKNDPGFDENFIKVNPNYVELSIELLDSESLVVQYFASFSLHYLLYHYLSSEYDEDVMKVCLPHALKIIIKVIEYAREYGKTSTAHIISIFLKNKEILDSVIEQTPYLIESIFDIALALVEENSNYLYVSNELSTLFSTLTNAIDQFDAYPDEEEILCSMIFKKCLDAFPVFQYFTSFYELIGIILGKSPNYDHDLYNLIFQPIVLTLVHVVKNPLIKGFMSEIALIFHNMMVRSPEFMLEMNFRSIQSIINDDDSFDPDTGSNSLFEIGIIIINNHNEDTTRNIYFSALINLIPPEEFPFDYLEEFILQYIENTDELELSSSAVYNYDSFVDLLLMILKLNAKWFCERDHCRMLSIYFHLINVVDIGCALVFVDDLIPVETRNNYISEIINDPPQTLFDNYEENSIDDIYYQMETNCVEQKHYYLRIFTNQQKLEIIQEYLNDLAENDPSFMEAFDDKRQNLINLLEFQFE